VAGFATEERLRVALARLREARAGRIETYTPRAIEGEPTQSPLPLIIFAAGVLGALGGFAMESYAAIVSYPIDIGGRPLFSWPSFVPIAFEIGVLCAVAAGVIGYFALNRMPRLYEPIDEVMALRRASRDRWFVAVEAEDLAPSRAILSDAGPVVLQEYAP
jgi:hypothetical protein